MTSIGPYTDFRKSKERFGFDCGCLVLTYLESFLFGASKQKSKRDLTSIGPYTDFGKSKESFFFSKTNLPAESTVLIRFRLWLSGVNTFGIIFIWRKQTKVKARFDIN